MKTIIWKNLKIKESINKIGFEETAKVYSISDSKKDGRIVMYNRNFK